MKYLLDFFKIKEINYKISKEKLDILTDMFNDENELKQMNSIVLSAKFDFIYGYEYKPKTIRKLVRYEDPVTALKLFRRASWCLDDKSDNIILKNNYLMKFIAVIFITIGLLGIFFFLISNIMIQISDIKIIYDNFINNSHVNWDTVTKSIFNIFSFVISIISFAVGINTFDEICCAKSFIDMQEKEKQSKEQSEKNNN